MKYYYLDGIEKKGPYSLEELISRKLNPNTLVFKEGSENWVKISEIELYSEQKSQSNFNFKRLLNNLFNWLRAYKKKVIITFVTFLVFILSYSIYDFFTLSESKARETSNRFFNMLVVNSLDENIFKEIYPSYKLIGDRLVFKKACKIKSISKNSDGDYEVFAFYQPHRLQNYPIYLLIGRENFKTVIKSSKGINYAYYDGVFEYGKKKGCLTGEEDDVLIGNVINEKNLRNELEFDIQLKLKSLYRNLKVTHNVSSNWGMISGDVTITNNNDIDFDYFDFECNVEFYDNNGRLLSSNKVYTLDEIKAFQSESGRVFNTSQNSSKFKIVPVINMTTNLKNKIIKNIISNTTEKCY